jgi:hypothetical protein
VKAAACSLFGLAPDDVEGPQKDSPHPACAALGEGASPRTAVVWLTEACKERMGDAFFSRRAFDAAASASQQRTTVFTDVRSQADVDDVLRRGGMVLKIVRPTRCGGSAFPWEDSIDCIHHDAIVVVYNDRDEDTLARRVADAVRGYTWTEC